MTEHLTLKNKEVCSSLKYSSQTLKKRARWESLERAIPRFGDIRKETVGLFHFPSIQESSP